MNTIEIKHKITGETLYTAIAKDGETLTVRSAIEMAVSDGSNLIGSDLIGADERGSTLIGAKMEDTPIIQNIHAVVYAAASVPGALNMNNWHCGTTHCRAGWVVTLAGEAGRILEGKIGTPAAAMAIYMASDPARWENEPLPDFYCSNSEALTDMKRMAEEGCVS